MCCLDVCADITSTSPRHSASSAGWLFKRALLCVKRALPYMKRGLPYRALADYPKEFYFVWKEPCSASFKRALFCVKRALPYVKRALLCIEPYIYYISHVNPKEPYSVTIQKRPTLCEKGLAMHAKFPITRKTSLLHVKKPYYMQKIPLTRKKIPITRTNSLLHLKNSYYM